MADDVTGESPATGISRRDALKKGALGAGVVGLVWAAPVIEGLTLTPAYAAGGSGGCSGNFAFDFTIPKPSTTHASVPKTTGCVGTLTTNDIQSVDFSGGIETITSNIVAGGPGCVFNALTYDGNKANDFIGARIHNAPAGLGTSSVTVQFVDDANQEGDLSAPKWGDYGSGDGGFDNDPTGDPTDTGHIHFTVTCT